MKTQVEQIIEQEKLDAIAAKVAETTATVTTTVTKSVSENIARNFLKSGSAPEEVAINTGLSLTEVMELQKNL